MLDYHSFLILSKVIADYIESKCNASALQFEKLYHKPATIYSTNGGEKNNDSVNVLLNASAFYWKRRKIESNTFCSAVMATLLFDEVNIMVLKPNVSKFSNSIDVVLTLNKTTKILSSINIMYQAKGHQSSSIYKIRKNNK